MAALSVKMGAWKLLVGVGMGLSRGLRLQRSPGPFLQGVNSFPTPFGGAMGVVLCAKSLKRAIQHLQKCPVEGEINGEGKPLRKM